MAIRAEGSRAAHKRNQQRRFCRIKPLRGAPKPGQRTSTHAFDIAALRGEGQPNAQDFPLAETRFQLEGAEDFNRLGAQPARARFQQPRRLHGDGGPARDHSPRAQPLPRGASKGQGINAGVLVEAPILRHDQQIKQNGGDIFRPGRQPPKATRRGQDRENASFAILHLHAHGMQAREVRREKPIQRERRQQHGTKASGEHP